MAGEALVFGAEAADILGITFVRFKVAVYRGLGLDSSRAPRGTEPKPVSGGWSARSAKYRAKDIRRMHAEYRFHTSRNSVPDYDWLRALPKAEYRRPTPVATPRAKTPPTPVMQAARPPIAAAARQSPAQRRPVPPRAFKLVEIQPQPFKVLDLFWS